MRSRILGFVTLFLVGCGSHHAVKNDSSIKANYEKVESIDWFGPAAPQDLHNVNLLTLQGQDLVPHAGASLMRCGDFVIYSQSMARKALLQAIES